MPLINSASPAAFRSNVSEMVRAHHPVKQALAAAFHMPRRDDGGGISGGGTGATGGVGGIAPSTQTSNPMMQGLVQRFASMPVEQLREMAVRMSGSPYAPVIQKIIQQKSSQPNQNSAQAAPQQQQPMAAAPPTMAQPQNRGGVTRRAGGGDISSSMGSLGSGYLNGDTLGRADAVRTTSPAGAYIVPADVISGLGEGNSLAGARIMDEVLGTGPFGTKLPAERRGAGPPRPPPPPQSDARGGNVKPTDVPAGRVPVLLSHGEYQISPEQVRRLGNGNLKHGHRILDAFVLHARASHIKKLKKLPGPVKT